MMNANIRTAMMAGSIAIVMVGMGFAAVPLYELFCRVTGFGGTTMVASEAQASTIQETSIPITVRFDANQRRLPWDFAPENPTEKVTIGAKEMTIYRAKNNSNEAVTGMATFNVTPLQAGQYFSKIQCFCFTEQTLKPGEEVRMPVLFYVDPRIMDDPNTKDIEEITLSYTFYPVDEEGEDS